MWCQYPFDCSAQLLKIRSQGDPDSRCCWWLHVGPQTVMIIASTKKTCHWVLVWGLGHLHLFFRNTRLTELRARVELTEKPPNATRSGCAARHGCRSWHRQVFSENVSNMIREDASRNQKLGKDKLGKIRHWFPMCDFEPHPTIQFFSANLKLNKIKGPLELGG